MGILHGDRYIGPLVNGIVNSKKSDGIACLEGDMIFHSVVAPVGARKLPLNPSQAHLHCSYRCVYAVDTVQPHDA